MRFKRRRIKPLTRRLQPWRTASFGGVRVHYKRHLDGGGSYFGQDFIPFLTGRTIPAGASTRNSWPVSGRSWPRSRSVDGKSQRRS